MDYDDVACLLIADNNRIKRENIQRKNQEDYMIAKQKSKEMIHGRSRKG